MPDMLRNIFLSAMMLYLANVRDGSSSLPFLSLGFTHCLILWDGVLDPLVLVHYVAWSGFELSIVTTRATCCCITSSFNIVRANSLAVLNLIAKIASSVGMHHLYLWAEQFMHGLPPDVVESLWWVFVSFVDVGRFQVFKETSTVYCNKKRHFEAIPDPNIPQLLLVV